MTLPPADLLDGAVMFIVVHWTMWVLVPAVWRATWYLRRMAPAWVLWVLLRVHVVDPVGRIMVCVGVPPGEARDRLSRLLLAQGAAAVSFIDSPDQLGPGLSGLDDGALTALGLRRITAGGDDACATT